MPGPHNAKHKRNNKKSKKRKQQSEKAQFSSEIQNDPILGAVNAQPQVEAESRPTVTDIPAVDSETNEVAAHPEQHSTPSPRPPSTNTTPKGAPSKKATLNRFSCQVITCPPIAAPELQLPYLHNPGTGPRVRAMRPFLSSTFASSPSWDDPLCAEFAQEEVLQMLCTLLPEEIALVIWHNKSRSQARVCPACLRLYRIGDNLPDLVPNINSQPSVKSPTSPTFEALVPQLRDEQIISGICSSMCFILASWAFSARYPPILRSIWGLTSEEIDDKAWTVLDDVTWAVLSPGSASRPASADMQAPRCTSSEGSLALLVRMTREEDLGLAELLSLDIPSSPDPEPPRYIEAQSCATPVPVTVS